MESTAATPMLRQYNDIKTKHKNCILFFRLGDFYEMFYEDAQTGSKILDLVLTSRGKTPNNIPMCGIPYHAAENYIARLIKAGQKVAICEQVEDPAAAKGIVKRDVTRIITSGTYLDETTSDARYILSLSPGHAEIGIAFTDPILGAIQTNQYAFNPNKIVELIAKLPVYECIYPESYEERVKKIFQHPLVKPKNVSLSAFEDWCFNAEIARKSLCEHFSIANLHGFGIEGLPYAGSSTGALLEYLKQMNKQPLRHISRVSLYTDEDYVYISPAAHAGLEIEQLIKALDHTQTAMGKRHFRFLVAHPLKSPEHIVKRQTAVRSLKHAHTLEELKIQLNKIPDLEKNISRLSCGYTHAKDLLAVRNTLFMIPALKAAVDPLAKENSLFALNDIKELRSFLNQTINEDVPLSAPEGKTIKRGFHQELDALKDVQENGREWLKRLQTAEIKKTGINSLKIGFNRVFGYYIEITKTNLNQVPEHYIRKQTLVNAERFITPELKEYEEKILTAQDKILRIENGIIKDIRARILEHSEELHAFCRSVAIIDCLFSFSILAQSPGYVLPAVNDGSQIDIKDGRHPVVEKTITDKFIPNDSYLDCVENHLMILTGPNMAGKSTYIRQTALLVLLAQTGSYIPAQAATIGIADKIFTRIGAHDDITRGQSTFMVEMNEAADILNNVTERSLIVLDEIGRGTSTYDGLSLAWALAEHLQKLKVRTLFATHFHELTALAEEYPGVKNYNVAVKEWKDEIIFLHKIVPGSTDDSYGIYVAKLAGLPPSVIQRAKHLLTRLELKSDKDTLKGNRSNEEQISLFAENTDPAWNEIKQRLEETDINTLTPLEALVRLKELKDKLEE